MRKLLWVGDANVSTGYAKSTHYILDVLRHLRDVKVLGINHLGDPHNYPYPIFPAISGGDAFGVGRIARLAKVYQFDCIVLQNDVWNIPDYMEQLKGVVNCPVVGFLAVDGKNCQGWKLNDLALAIFWTKFAEEEARLGGYTGKSTVIPLGVDLDVFKPVNKDVSRTMLNIHSAVAKPTNESFIVLNVNRNQYRKRLDLTVEYFCDWVDQYQITDTYLMIHACPTHDDDFDVEQLMEYRGHRDKLLYIKPNVGFGVSELQLAIEYTIADVMITTTQGEGFGLTTFEGMACGVPQIVPDWAALGEYGEDACIRIPCTSHAVTANGINVIGGIADREAFVHALNDVYEHKAIREHFSKFGLARVKQDKFRWANIGKAFEKALDGIST